MGAMYRTNPTSFMQTRPALCGQFDGYPPPTSIGEFDEAEFAVKSLIG